MENITKYPYNATSDEAQRLHNGEQSMIALPVEPVLHYPTDKLTLHPNGTIYVETPNGSVYNVLDMLSPLGQPGDEVLVREVWSTLRLSYDWETGLCDDYKECEAYQAKDGIQGLKPHYGVAYRSGGNWDDGGDTPEERGFAWRSPVTMPSWASRTRRVVEDVRVVQLAHMTEANAQALGLEGDRELAYHRNGDSYEHVNATPFEQWIEQWNARYGDTYPAEGNPWIWLVELEDVE